MISDKSVETLSNWIGVLHEGMETMSGEELEKAKSYINNLVNSWGEVADSVNDVKNLYMDLNTD